MLIKFVSLSLQNYKSHQDLQVNFAEVTKITGDNAKGKSSILESISWLLYGTDALGSKCDPTPITYAADETLVQLLLSADEKQVLLGRGLTKGKAEYYINEASKSATAFNELVKSLFDKDLFLSLFNPNYFFTLKWNEQRAMILKYVIAPANKEVLKQLPTTQSDRLGELLKKHSLVEIEDTHKKNKTKKDKEYIAAQSRTKTLREQLDQLTDINVPLESIKVESSQIEKQIKEIERITDSAGDKNRAYNTTQSRLRGLQDQIEMSKERWPSLKNEPIEDACRTCKQPLKDESIKAVQDDKESRIAQYKTNHNALIKQREELKTQLADMEYIDVSEQIEKVRELENKRQPLLNALRNFGQYEHLQKQVETAKVSENETLQSLNDSIFVLDSIKAFNAKSAELQGEKVQALFEKLSIRLFKENKGDGEIKPDFEIELDGKGYRKLSLSEGIRAGLELRDVLSKQSEVIVPCMVDNCESITKFKQPNGQLITSRVVAGQELKIEVAE